MRPIDSTDARPIAGTDGASFPFWSPDSQALGFYSGLRGRLERVDLAGSAPVVIARAGYVRGASWGPDGIVLYDTSDGGGQIMEVAIADGTPKSLVQSKDGSVKSPWVLPDGKHFLYVKRSEGQIHVASRDGTSDKVLTDASSHAVYAAGHLIFMRENALLAQPFDPTTLELRGSAQPIARDVQMLLGDPRGVFSASDTGTLLYLDGAATSSMTLAWFDDKGTRAGIVGEVGSARGLRLSPDGRTAGIGSIDVEGHLNLWAVDVATNTHTQLTFMQDMAALGSFLVWAPDGRSLTYAVKRDNGYAIARRPSGGGAEEILYMLPPDQSRIAAPRISAWTNDGSTILYSGSTLGGIWSLPLAPNGSGTRAAHVLVGDPQTAQNVRLRPGDRWFCVPGRSGRRHDLRDLRRGVSRWRPASAGGRARLDRALGSGREVAVLRRRQHPHRGQRHRSRRGPALWSSARHHAGRRRTRLFLRRCEGRPHPGARLERGTRSEAADARPELGGGADGKVGARSTMTS